MFFVAVPKLRSFLKYWLPTLVWMMIIFSASGDTKSFQHSSRIIAPLLHWLLPHLSEHAVDAVVTALRKCAHLTEYAVLALLFWRALRKPVRHDARPWSWREPAIAVLLVALYAASDEYHQRFVPSRDASVRDVLIDTTGAIAGMILLWGLWKWRASRRNDSGGGTASPLREPNTAAPGAER